MLPAVVRERAQARFVIALPSSFFLCLALIIFVIFSENANVPQYTAAIDWNSDTVDTVTLNIRNQERNRTLSDVWKRFNITNMTAPVLYSVNCCDGNHNLVAINADYNVSYLTIPKCGGTTIKRIFGGGNQRRGEKMQCHIGTPRCNRLFQKVTFRFTFLRDPMARFVSGYKTLVARSERKKFRQSLFDDNKGIKPPSVNASVMEWRQHFNDELYLVLTQMDKLYGKREGIRWNQHLLRQLDFIKGHDDLDFIGCIYDREWNVTKRQYEVIHNLTGLPGFGKDTEIARPPNFDVIPNNYREFVNVESLNEENKKIVRRVYEEDYELFEFLCGTNDNPDPMF